jgi:SagB-type dehydrogenase family enzyme
MKNREIKAAWVYHNGTKHSYQSIRATPHHLDWENQPLPFKIYPKLEPIALSQQISSSAMPALSVISAFPASTHGATKLTRQNLAALLFLCAGVTRRRSYPGGEILFRAAACTGALYHIDLYLVCGELEDLAAGVYHFSPHDFALRRLRQGDFRADLVSASGAEPAIARAPCIVISASTFWRNAWKYQSRAYRHCFWDNGTMLANLLAAAAARNIPARVVAGFVDESIRDLLALDDKREAPLSLVALGDSADLAVMPALPLEPLALETVPLSKSEVAYPAMREMHLASALATEAEVVAWRIEGLDGAARDEEKIIGRLFPLKPLDDGALPRDKIEEVIIRRGSARQFAQQSIASAELSTALDRASRGIPADFLNGPEVSLNSIYLIVHAVDDLPAGAYFYRRTARALELLKEGDFRREAGYLGLGQEIPADCSVNVYFLTNLEAVLERFGNRGYRAAQLEAAILAGKLYLAAYAQRLSASGLTFFDDDVTDFFSPHAAGKSVMFLLALGRAAKRKGLNAL